MADEKVLIEFDIDYGNSLKESRKMTEQLLSLKDQLKANNAARADIQHRMKQGEKVSEKEIKSIDRLRKEELGLKDAIAETNQLRKKAIDVMKITANTLEGVRKQTKALFAEREKLDTSTKKGAKRFQELTNKIKSNNDQIKKADQAAGSYTSSIGNYKDAMVGVSPVFARQVMLLGQIKTALIATKAGLVTNVTGLKILRTAMISTGIGALVVAFGALITFLTKTQRGMDGVSKVMAAVGAAVDVVIDRVSAMGESLFKIIEGITSFDADLISEGLDGIAKGFEGIVEEIVKEADAAHKLEEEFQKLRDNEIAFISKRAEMERDINKLRVQAAEVQEESAAQSLAYLEEAEIITRKLISIEQEFAKEELRISEQRLALGESTREEIEETENLRARVFEQEGARLRKLTSIEKEQLTLRRTARKEALEEQQELQKQQDEKDEERLEKIKELNDLRIETQLDQSEEAVAIKVEGDQLEIDSEIAKTARIIEIKNELFQNSKKIFGLISQALNASLKNEETRINRSYSRRQKQLKESFERGEITQEEFDTKSMQLEKDKQLALYKIEKKRFENNQTFALLGVAVDIAGAVAKVWAQTGIGGIVAQFLPIAAGLIQASIIASQEPPPPPEFAAGGDVKSGILGGKYHSAGGVNFSGSDGTRFTAEKDEGIFITKRRATAEALSLINQKYGGRSFFDSPGRFFASGGSVIGAGDNTESIRQIIKQTLKSVKIVTRVEDIQTGLIDYNEIINEGVVE